MSGRRRWLLGSALALLALGVVAIGWTAFRISSRVLEVRPMPGLEPQQDPRSAHGLAFEDVALSTSDRVTLRGWLVRPQGRARAGVVLAHGRGGTRRSSLWWLPALHRAGYCAVLYDTRGAGESDSGGPGGGFNRGYLDIAAAAELLEDRCQVEGIAVVGASQGGSNAIMAAADSKRIDAVVAFGAGPTLYDVLRASPGLRSMPDWMIALVTRLSLWRMGLPLQSVLDLGSGPVDRIDRLAPRALLLVHGRHDDVIPIGQAGRLYARAKPPKRMWIIEDARHSGLSPTQRAELAHRTLGFLDEHLPR